MAVGALEKSSQAKETGCWGVGAGPLWLRWAGTSSLGRGCLSRDRSVQEGDTWVPESGDMPQENAKPGGGSLTGPETQEFPQDGQVNKGRNGSRRTMMMT